MKIEKILHELGLNKSKADVYLAALQVGSGSTQEIASRANISRTTVHEILQPLVRLGLVSFITEGRKRIYTAEKPTKLKNLLLEKERRLDLILPDLLSLYNTSGSRPHVRFFEGIEGIKTVFEDTLTVRDKKLYGILSMEDLYAIPGKEYMDDYVERRVAVGIKLFVIRSEGKEVEETWGRSTKENREVHFATGNLIFPMTVYMYDGKVGIIGTQKENFGMIIESFDLYITFKNMFDVLYQVSKVAPRKD